MIRLICVASIWAIASANENYDFCSQTTISSVFQVDQSTYFNFLSRMYVWESGMDVPQYTHRMAQMYYFTLKDKSPLNDEQVRAWNYGLSGFYITTAMDGVANVGLLANKAELDRYIIFEKVNENEFRFWEEAEIEHKFQNIIGMIRSDNKTRAKTFLYIPDKRMILVVYKSGCKYSVFTGNY